MTVPQEQVYNNNMYVMMLLQFIEDITVKEQPPPFLSLGQLFMAQYPMWYQKCGC